MGETQVKLDTKVPLAVIITLSVSIGGTYAHTQSQIALMEKTSTANQIAITEIRKEISGIDVMDNKIENITSIVNRIDRRLQQQDEFKIR